MNGSPPAASTRRDYLDWLRGVGVLIMIAGHALDAWTAVEDRERLAYRWAIVVAGFGAPVFLFLAGVSQALAADGRVRKGATPVSATVAALRRGAWILALAFVFRLQSMVISGGAFPESLFKVDILNVLGVSMILGAVCWYAGARVPGRFVAFVIATVALAMTTPLVREAGWLGVLPDWLERYFRPTRDSTTFTLFPWAGFLTAGGASGVLLARTRPGSPGEARFAGWLAAAGVTGALVGYASAFLPPLYARSHFWTSSPTFFFLRAGIVAATVAIAYVVTRNRPGSVLKIFGRHSLFVYWIHVEMAYGVISSPLHRRLPLEGTVFAILLFSWGLYGLVRLNERARRGLAERRAKPLPPSH